MRRVGALQRNNVQAELEGAPLQLSHHGFACAPKAKAGRDIVEDHHSAGLQASDGHRFAAEFRDQNNVVAVLEPSPNVFGSL